MTTCHDPEGLRLPVNSMRLQRRKFVPILLEPVHHHANFRARTATSNAKRLGLIAAGFLCVGLRRRGFCWDERGLRPCAGPAGISSSTRLPRSIRRGRSAVDGDEFILTCRVIVNPTGA